MRETADDLSALQQLLDASYAGAGEHLLAIFTPDNRLTAVALVAALDGIFEMHVATVTADGAPLVAPLDGVFYRGKLWFGFPGASVRARLVRRDPRVSASFTRETFAFIVHGRACEAGTSPDLAGFDALRRELYTAQYGPGWPAWFERLPPGGFDGWIEPARMFVKR